MFRVLDVIIPGQPYRPHRRPDLIEEIIDTIKPQEITDTVAVDDTVTDTISSAQAMAANAGTGGDDNTILMWSIFAVLFALAMCLYFVYKYRKHTLAY